MTVAAAQYTMCAPPVCRHPLSAKSQSYQWLTLSVAPAGGPPLSSLLSPLSSLFMRSSTVDNETTGDDYIN